MIGIVLVNASGAVFIERGSKDMNKGTKFEILNGGYIKLIDYMGSDESVIESARMSTGKGFFGWYWDKDTYADLECHSCGSQQLLEEMPREENTDLPLCTNCWETQEYGGWKKPENPKLLGKAGAPRDLNLLEFLMMNRHSTPFEMGDLVIEAYVPIMVLREWYRHRTQSYSEFSARYSQMPNKHYLPSLGRIKKQSVANKQGSAEPLPLNEANLIVEALNQQQQSIYRSYDDWVRAGVAKEVARLNTPVARYSKMRAKANLRNWLAFLSLRMELGAQWEIQQCARAIAKIIKAIWPETFHLFMEHEFLAVRFSRREIRALVRMFERHLDLRSLIAPFGVGAGLEDKKIRSLVMKLSETKESKYEDLLAELGE